MENSSTSSKHLYSLYYKTSGIDCNYFHTCFCKSYVYTDVTIFFRHVDYGSKVKPMVTK